MISGAMKWEDPIQKSHRAIKILQFQALICFVLEYDILKPYVSMTYFVKVAVYQTPE